MYSFSNRTCVAPLRNPTRQTHTTCAFLYMAAPRHCHPYKKKEESKEKGNLITTAATSPSQDRAHFDCQTLRLVAPPDRDRIQKKKNRSRWVEEVEAFENSTVIHATAKRKATEEETNNKRHTAKKKTSFHDNAQIPVQRQFPPFLPLHFRNQTQPERIRKKKKRNMPIFSPCLSILRQKQDKWL